MVSGIENGTRNAASADSGPWYDNARFYHIYPLGLCGAPQRNDGQSAPVSRILALAEWADHIASLGLNAVYLGPVFESDAHGYDTRDYFRLDRRLGTNDDFRRVVEAFHARGIRVVPDAVFNHVGSEHFAFRDLRRYGQASRYAGWFQNVRFDGQSPCGDPFRYEGWAGNYDLVKLNLRNPEVKEHLFAAVKQWREEYGIDGLRLDAADVMDLEFLSELSNFCRGLAPDFFLLGEVVHGDYRKHAPGAGLHSVTDYECHKGLWSSLNDKNYFEIAYALKRQFGEGGMYRGLPMYQFADNHDVARAASALRDKGHLFPLYAMLFTVPGVPSVYYGSEWGIEGKKIPGGDWGLRPALTVEGARKSTPCPELEDAVRRLSRLRASLPALARGDYREILVKSEQFAFERSRNGERVLVAINAAAEAAEIDVPLPGAEGEWRDVLNGGCAVFHGGRAKIEFYPRWARIFVPA
jgi:glycosidase